MVKACKRLNLQVGIIVGPILQMRKLWLWGDEGICSNNNSTAEAQDLNSGPGWPLWPEWFWLQTWTFSTSLNVSTVQLSKLININTILLTWPKACLFPPGFPTSWYSLLQNWVQDPPYIRHHVLSPSVCGSFCVVLFSWTWHCGRGQVYCRMFLIWLVWCFLMIRSGLWIWEEEHRRMCTSYHLILGAWCQYKLVLLS